jgi:hypothetical protein
MTFEYRRLPDVGEELRLHLNENTAGVVPHTEQCIARLEEVLCAAR